MEPKVKHVMFAEAPFALKRLSSITKPAAKKDMPKTKSMFERMEPAMDQGGNAHQKAMKLNTKPFVGSAQVRVFCRGNIKGDEQYPSAPDII